MSQYFDVWRICFETTSAIHPGTGTNDLLEDMPIQLDANGIPIIHGTGIAGVLRSLLEEDNAFQVKKWFGGNNKRSPFKISDALLLDENNHPVEGLLNGKSPYLDFASHLNTRDHCAINDRGAARENAKFDRTVLLKGMRFILEFSVEGNSNSKEEVMETAKKIAVAFRHPAFRIGGATRNGFGNIRILSCERRGYNLAVDAEREAYLNQSQSLTEKLAGAENVDIAALPQSSGQSFERREIRLKARDFFLVSSGFPEGNLDICPKYEKQINWEKLQENKSELPTEDCYLLPATSIKGALAHRTAYHYNRENGRTIDCNETDEVKKEKLLEYSYQKNPAVTALFGEANGDNTGKCGNILISDIYLSSEDSETKAMNHNSIDRFTGGSLDGALFTEELLFRCEFTLEIVIMKTKDNQDYIRYFDKALEDLKNGSLPLGGGVMRGHGMMEEIQ